MSTTPVLQASGTTETLATQALTLVCLPSLASEALDATLANLHSAFPEQPLLIATPDAVPSSAVDSGLRVVTYAPSTTAVSAWVPIAADYLNAWTLAREHRPGAVLLLGAESASVHPETLRQLSAAVLDRHDLVLPRYPVGSHEGLFNSAILYPLTRALFSQQVRIPLPIDAALSARMAERLGTAAQRLTASGQGDGLVWPVADASVAGFSVREVEGRQRTLPAPGVDDFNTLLANVAGSLFADVEAKASFWQRARLAPVPAPAPMYAIPASTRQAGAFDLAPMIESFRNAYTNLRELWSLVLPPNSLLALKKLSVTPADSFRMSDGLWARIIYDFLLAYRLRTINRSHLLGALTPLYLAWVASHLRLVDADANAVEQHNEAVAAAFENDKPYLVSRWRWPDRFNP